MFHERKIEQLGHLGPRRALLAKLGVAENREPLMMPTLPDTTFEVQKDLNESDMLINC
jgi:hypothetical protein